MKAVLRVALLLAAFLSLAARCLAEPIPDELTLVPQFAAVAPLSPQQKADRRALAEEIANPISTLSRVPLRWTYTDGIGPKHADTVAMLAQPLIPFTLNQNWNVITQTNIPITYESSVAPGVDSAFGLSDTLQGIYLVPTEPSKRGWLYGIGPAFQFPTATNNKLGTGQWCAGPTGAMVRQVKGWTYGIIAHQLWSFAGDDNRKPVNTTLVHPLFTYTWPTGTGLTLESDSGYDWEAQRWTVPVMLTLSQVAIRGRRPVEISVSGRYFAEKPEGGPDWAIRFSVIFLFPK